MNQSDRRIHSPCVGNCCLDDDDFCLGCFRHIEEIKAWGLIDDEERLKIIKLSEQRGEQRILNKNIV